MASKIRSHFLILVIEFLLFDIKKLIPDCSQLKAKLIPIIIRFKRAIHLYTNVIRLVIFQFFQFNTNFG